jgi:hypothetical protein
VNTAGDGFLAMFDGPQRATRCALAIPDAVQALGIEVRAGLHTGECEARGDDIGGIGVHIGARVSALAGPNDVLVSSTLRDLVIGSGLEFDERGSYELKACPASGASSPSPLRERHSRCLREPRWQSQNMSSRWLNLAQAFEITLSTFSQGSRVDQRARRPARRNRSQQLGTRITQARNITASEDSSTKPDAASKKLENRKFRRANSETTCVTCCFCSRAQRAPAPTAPL